MVVRQISKQFVRDLGDEGQSVLEFLLMLPMMVGLTIILVKVNTAIQISIVNQQYARAQALFLTFNSPQYPRLALREAALIAKNTNMMFIGVSQNQASSDDGDEYYPEAATQNVTRKSSPGGSNDSQAEPPQRGLVRVRSIVALCTQPNFVGSSPVLPLASSGTTGTLEASGQYNLGEGSRFDYCRSPYQ